MDRLDPDKIDDIFRESAENTDFPFNEAAWEDMESRLDKRDNRRRVLFFFFAAVGLAAFLFIMNGISNRADIAEDESRTEENIALVQGASGIKTELSGITIDSKPVMNDPQVGAADGDVIIKESLTGIDNNESISHSTVISVVLPAESTDRSLDVNNYIEQTSRPIKRNNAINQDKRTEKIARDIEEDLRKLPVNYSTHLASDEERTLEEPTISIDDAPESAGHAYEGYVGLSRIGTQLDALNKSGVSGGFLFSKAINDRLEFSVGVGLSKQNYSCPGTLYQNEDEWAAGVSPETMDGLYVMTEIPLELRYFFNGTNNNGFLIKGGISGYLLNKEWYGFHYTDAGIEALAVQGMDPLMEVTEHNTLNLEAVANIGIGYQAKINKRTSVLISPYLQVPITDVGIGKIQLYSGGVRLGLKLHR